MRYKNRSSGSTGDLVTVMESSRSTAVPKLRRKHSLPTFLKRPKKSSLKVVTVEESLHSTWGSSSQVPKNVEWDKIHIREYARTVGDNPSCSSGPPLSISWEYNKETIVLTIDEYESERPPRRSQYEMVLPRDVRFTMLREEWLVTQSEISIAIRTNVKTKIQRRHTVNNLRKLTKLKEAMESAKRKVTRMMRMQSSMSRQVDQLTKHSMKAEEEKRKVWAQMDTLRFAPQIPQSVPTWVEQSAKAEEEKEKARLQMESRGGDSPKLSQSAPPLITPSLKVQEKGTWTLWDTLGDPHTKKQPAPPLQEKETWTQLDTIGDPRTQKQPAPPMAEQTLNGGEGEMWMDTLGDSTQMSESAPQDLTKQAKASKKSSKKSSKDLSKKSSKKSSTSKDVSERRCKSSQHEDLASRVSDTVKLKEVEEGSGQFPEYFHDQQSYENGPTHLDEASGFGPNPRIPRRSQEDKTGHVQYEPQPRQHQYQQERPQPTEQYTQQQIQTHPQQLSPQQQQYQHQLQMPQYSTQQFPQPYQQQYQWPLHFQYDQAPPQELDTFQDYNSDHDVLYVFNEVTNEFVLKTTMTNSFNGTI